MAGPGPSICSCSAVRLLRCSCRLSLLHERSQRLCRPQLAGPRSDVPQDVDVDDTPQDERWSDRPHKAPQARFKPSHRLRRQQAEREWRVSAARQDRDLRQIRWRSKAFVFFGVRRRRACRLLVKGNEQRRRDRSPPPVQQQGRRMEVAFIVHRSCVV